MANITKPICRKCGSDNVGCDAFAKFECNTGAWELSSTYDHTDCLDCGYETDTPPWLLWDGAAWVKDPADHEPLMDSVLARINDMEAMRPSEETILLDGLDKADQKYAAQIANLTPDEDGPAAFSLSA